jgi:dTDP-4-amino-4,6-dideoxygalactose transaminase
VLKTVPVSVGQFNFLSADDYSAVLKNVLESGWYTNHGPEAQQLESDLAILLGVRHCLTVSNATLGLAIALESVGQYSRIVMPAVSFPATLWSAQFLGKPVQLVEIDANTGHVDPDALRCEVREGDLLVIPNLYGAAAPIAAVEEVASDKGSHLIFDSAGSLGTRHEQKLLGAFGDCEVFSLHATKIVSGGEGGFITTNSDDLADRIRSMRSSYGNSKPVEVTRTANARLGEMQAGCARRSLGNLETYIKHNVEILKIYETTFSQHKGLLRSLGTNSGVEINGSSCTYLIESENGVSSSQLVEDLWKIGIRARRYYNPGLHRLPSTALLDVRHGDLHLADSFLKRVIQFPVGGQVSHELARQIAEMVIERLAYFE